jgi:hypothetical protein
MKKISDRANVSDRAQRYRANRAVSSAEKRCAYCGNPQAGDVEHVDGDESNNHAFNLVRACRSCNVLKGKVFTRSGIGVRTVQMNPSGRGITDYRQYLTVIGALKGRNSAMSLKSAIALMHNTPSSRRSEFQRQIWQVRKERAGGDIPF